jgi:hypothetical protein
MDPSQIVVLMTGTAMDRCDAISVGAAPHVHDVPVEIVALPRIIARRVAHHAPRMPQHGRDVLESGDSCGAAGRWKVSRRLPQPTEFYACDGEQRNQQWFHADLAPV